jgi:peptidylprolyl isomerase
VQSLKRLIPLAAVFALVFGLGACGSDSSSQSTTSKTGEQTSEHFRIPEGKPPVRREATLNTDGTKLLGPEPKPIIPDSPPPETLALQNLIEGVGHHVQSGDKVSIQYVGYDYETGEKFISSWDQGKPTHFVVGSGKMIEGIEEGLLETEVGARREMVIPPAMGYGSRRVGKVPPNSHLVFVVDLLAAE